MIPDNLKAAAYDSKHSWGGFFHTQSFKSRMPDGAPPLVFIMYLQMV